MDPLRHDADNRRFLDQSFFGQRLDFLESHILELYLFGPRFTAADAYLFVMLRWATASRALAQSASIASCHSGLKATCNSLER